MGPQVIELVAYAESLTMLIRDIAASIAKLPRLFFLVIQRAPLSTLFPYTTLFRSGPLRHGGLPGQPPPGRPHDRRRSDRKSTRLNSSHLGISYAVFCLKKKIQTKNTVPTREAYPIMQVHLPVPQPSPEHTTVQSVC